MKIEFTKKRQTLRHGEVYPGLVKDIARKEASAYIKNGIAKEYKDGRPVSSDS